MLFTGLDEEGLIHWDDEDGNNHNSFSGELPEGTYNKDTDIKYCCRSDGFASNAIILPTDRDFVLLRYKSSQCQKVKGTTSEVLFFTWDTENNNPKTRVEGPIDAEVFDNSPFPELMKFTFLKMYYCLYQSN